MGIKRRTFEAQGAFGSPQGCLKAVVMLISHIVERKNLPDGRRVHTKSIWVGELPCAMETVTSCFQVHKRWVATGDRGEDRIVDRSLRQCETGTIVGTANRAGERLARKKWVVHGAHWLKLVLLKLGRQMSSLAAYISDAANERRVNLALHTQVPLLDVGPDGLLWNLSNVERERSCSARGSITKTDAFVTGGEILGHIEHQRRATFEGPCICFVARSMLVEYSVAGPHGRLPI